MAGMNPMERGAILVSLVRELQEKGSWCGETHIQKVVYFLQTTLDVPTGYNYILYKHGPFSFDLRDELTSLRAASVLDFLAQPAPYGPSFVPGENAPYLDRFAAIVKQHHRKIRYIASVLGPKRVVELERVATALFVARRSADKNVEDIATEINRLKPHISVIEARQAVEDAMKIVKESRSIVGQT